MCTLLHDALERLEAISSSFDYNRIEQYMRMVKDFRISMKKENDHETYPLRDVCERLALDLPIDVKERLMELFRSKPDYSPTVRSVCEWYLREIAAMERGFVPVAASSYEPLIQMLESGGDFYEHHGGLCIRDAATVQLGRIVE
jgi:hypothetical protein